MFGIATGLDDDPSWLNLVDVNQRHEYLVRCEFFHQSGDIVRDAGTVADGIEVAQTTVQNAAPMAGVSLRGGGHRVEGKENMSQKIKRT